ncbi:cobalt transporter [Chroococcidiopsis sp. CCALA 051]|jgi:membrane fusion protein, cation efflux system|uniref:efflux RND transporter periplasmic adaptor subunit n=1 Tax=Chroococcidiopsis sp. CCALA 051 TaxID=869949 RepID=UPI000D0D168A|nr:efflux RND transporter periplasmic adaptor subunit [Chroococcidiopsis sp. CCALA 051]PSM50344.1 cobalt transporter [Chroococcidiopsis sp. CCALA 051]
MKPFALVSSILAVSLIISAPAVVFAHVGHGDEFQASGGTQRVKVNPQTDQMLGIVVKPIAAADGGAAVMIPVTALVDADGKQLVFVQYENFYEPVEISTGATKGELVEVTKGLSVGEKLVTQGGLSLYAESRKTQTAASPQTPNTHAQADAQGIPHSHDPSGNMAQQPGNAAQPSSGFPIGFLVAFGGGAALLIGGIALMSRGRKKKSTFSNKRGGF